MRRPSRSIELFNVPNCDGLTQASNTPEPPIAFNANNSVRPDRCADHVPDSMMPPRARACRAKIADAGAKPVGGCWACQLAENGHQNLIPSTRNSIEYQTTLFLPDAGSWGALRNNGTLYLMATSFLAGIYLVLIVASFQLVLGFTVLAAPTPSIVPFCSLQIEQLHQEGRHEGTTVSPNSFRPFVCDSYNSIAGGFMPSFFQEFASSDIDPVDFILGTKRRA